MILSLRNQDKITNIRTLQHEKIEYFQWIQIFFTFL